MESKSIFLRLLLLKCKFFNSGQVEKIFKSIIEVGQLLSAMETSELMILRLEFIIF